MTPDQALDGPARRLLLLRHAKAEHPEGLPDHQRPLSLVGRRQSGRVGTQLAEAGLVPDLVLCSTSLRTRQTWDLVRGTLGADPVLDLRDDVYDAGLSTLLDVVRAVPDDAATVLVVGHEPTMSRVAATLAGPGSDEAALARVQVGVPTASWSLLGFAGSWADLAPGAATLQHLGVPG
ncbi:SixA phosphatase family protein [Cellulomonas fimi]|uniref:Putative phosphohistidine phosphatase, SixA n=1 Tax=Cellulomonas fimi (strain ATCC 484 / DSM 20113 / JCM 1341 / CCUG 24087 / LMG 16345 / NBRC 15513 / NCIMB 8980 / NCTC 7547 / NRS-133) TaxID=590998 RepID=F4H8G7_CELFA|nr:histidine phosphatase family protein [Cellulomonas fimi]AEE45848.1 putative phosphohistidine phosphatase, SixA [Cellulomonas fimi ATCC 484]NNH07832.1 histidine phosphatase family protein [Cellulomonas fimi]VEH30777.1 phosphohistidine phosphatase [Cellulomonas fimi]